MRSPHQRPTNSDGSSAALLQAITKDDRTRAIFAIEKIDRRGLGIISFMRSLENASCYSATAMLDYVDLFSGFLGVVSGAVATMNPGHNTRQKMSTRSLSYSTSRHTKSVLYGYWR